MQLNQCYRASFSCITRNKVLYLHHTEKYGGGNDVPSFFS